MQHDGGTALLRWLREQLDAATSETALTAHVKLIHNVVPRVDRREYIASRQYGWQIGTEVIGSTCPQRIGQWLKCPCMYWSEHGARATTDQQATALNGDRNSCWNSQARCA